MRELYRHRIAPERREGDRPPVLPPLNAAVLVQITVARATELARTGRYAAAETLLADVLRSAEPPLAALDLYARICAQQGQVSEAEACWTQAARRDPANAVYQAGLRRIAVLQRRPSWLAPVFPILVGCAVALGVVLAGRALQHAVSDLRASLGAEVARGAAGHAAAHAQLGEEIRRDVRALHTAVQAEVAQLATVQAQATSQLREDIQQHVEALRAALSAEIAQLAGQQAVVPAPRPPLQEGPADEQRVEPGYP